VAGPPSGVDAPSRLRFIEQPTDPALNATEAVNTPSGIVIKGSNVEKRNQPRTRCTK